MALINMLQLYNTLTRKKEKFKPLNKNKAGLYTCGPTVYNYAHLGNLRTYIFEDILKRVLIYNGYEVKHVMNVTDVGHLTGDRDMGEDKLEKGAKREGKSAWEISDFYWRAFRKDMKKLDILEPDIWCRATDNIKKQIELIKTLERKGYTYKISDGVYFNTSKFPDYNKLSHQPLAALEEGARVEKNNEKKNSTDFALWKFSPKNAKRQMEWQSPWGIGFPGWHIECSAMSMKYLGKELDIHCGGIDHVNIHHTNEIAQSESATGKKFFNYWLHGAFLNIANGKKMAKSTENFLTLENALLKKNINPLSYRYACLTVHYRKPMEWSEKSIESAANALNNLYEAVSAIKDGKNAIIDKKYQYKFLTAINDDLNMPRALAIVWEVLNSKLQAGDKKATLLDFDKVMGLNLSKVKKEKIIIPAAVKKLAAERETARKNKEWKKADEIRKKIAELGFAVEDAGEKSVIKKK